MMVVPVDADIEKAQHVVKKHRQQRLQRGQVVAVRHLQFQHHDGDDDGEHAIAEGFESVLGHAARILSQCRRNSNAKFRPRSRSLARSIPSPAKRGRDC